MKFTTRIRTKDKNVPKTLEELQSLRHTHTRNDATLHLKHKMTTKTMLNGQKTEKAQNYIKIITTITFFSLLVFQLFQ